MKTTASKDPKKPIIVKVGNAVVKIYRGKSRGYDIFTVVHYAGGERKREAFANLDEAKRRADEVAHGMLNDRLSVLTLTSADRENYVAALRLLEPLGVPLRAAVEEYVAARAELDGESLLAAVKDHASRRRKVLEKPINEVVAEFLAAKKRDGLSKRHTDTLRDRLNRFSEAFHTNIGSVTSRMLEDWLVSLSVGGRTRNNYRADIVNFFHFARARGYLLKGHATEADDVPIVKDRGNKIGIFTPKQMATLMKKSKGNIRLYLALGAFSGIRSEELLRLDFEDITWSRGHITVARDKAKTAARRLVPVLPNLMQYLAPYRRRTGRIFQSRRTVDNVTAFAKDQGIEWPHNALRHSYATYRLAVVHDAARVALEMGNSPQKLMTNYRELADEHDARAWFAISPKAAKNVVPIAA